MLIKKLLKFSLSLNCGLLLFFVSFGIFFSSTTVKVNAQENTPILGFEACTPEGFQRNQTSGTEALVNCFRQISTILLIFGILVGGILTARDTLKTYIPGEEVDATKDMRERLMSLIIGVVLISLPGAILSLFNPATTSLDFLSGLGEIRDRINTGGNANGSINNNPSNPSGGGNGQDQNNTGGQGQGGQNGQNGGSNNSQNQSRQSSSSIANYTQFTTGKQTYLKDTVPIPIDAKGEASCTNVYFYINEIDVVSQKVCGDPANSNYYGSIPYIKATQGNNGTAGASLFFTVEQNRTIQCDNNATFACNQPGTQVVK